MRGAGKSSSMAALTAARQAGAAPAGLLAAGLALLIAAWVFGNPPGAGPDERAHYVRALGAGDLELAGATFHPTPEQRKAFVAAGSQAPPLPGAGLATVLWAAKQTRTFGVPRDLSVFAFGCNDQKPDQSAACVDHPRGAPSARLPTYTGTYPPWVYVVPGAAMRTQHAPSAALRAGRLVSALLCFALLAAAIALTGSAAPAVAGLAVALTPMVVYCASVLNASGPEIAGSLCFLAAGFRLQRPGAGAAAWVALAAGGAALALSRALGPPLLVALAATLLILHGRRPRRPPPAGVAAIAVLVVTFALGAWWDVAESPQGVEGGPSFGDALTQTLHDLDDIARHAVGNFGALDTLLPTWLYVLWGALAAALVVLAAVHGTWRQRAGLLLCLGVAGGVTVVVSVVQLRTGYGAQGRHVLPVLVLVPLYAGEVLRSRPMALLPALAGVVWAVGQAVAWLTNARRGAVGTEGSWWFLGDADWSPPLGWTLWGALAALGILLALAGYLSPARRSRSTPPSSASTAT
jgi:hypothetical protein